MARSYRLYRLDGAGKISTAEWIQAERDDEAVSKLAALDEKGPCELWEGRRVVIRIRD